MKTLKSVTVIFVGLGTIFFAAAADFPRSDVYLKMAHLRSQINALDAQRELMQINASYVKTLARDLVDTAEDTLKIIGPGIPEHQMGLSGVSRLGSELEALADKGDVAMLVKANSIRHQCTTCHAQETPAGGVNWDELFKSDWTEISKHCNEPGLNPYLCRSMNGMLSAYSSLFTSQKAGYRNFEVNKAAADEVIRILVDIQAKNFNHLPEQWRALAESDARELSELAAQKSEKAFDKIKTITRACTECHQDMAPKSTSKLSHNTPMVSWALKF